MRARSIFCGMARPGLVALGVVRLVEVGRDMAGQGFRQLNNQLWPGGAWRCPVVHGLAGQGWSGLGAARQGFHSTNQFSWPGTAVLSTARSDGAGCGLSRSGLAARGMARIYDR